MPKKLGTPGGDSFPYWIETPSEQFIVYEKTMLLAVRLFSRSHDTEPMLVRQMADNE